MEKATWLVEYKRLLTAYGKAPNSAQAALYFEALADVDDAVVSKAVSGAILKCPYFPTIAELATRCGPATTDDADPLYPQFRRWQVVNADDPQMLSITFPMFRHFIESTRA